MREITRQAGLTARRCSRAEARSVLASREAALALCRRLVSVRRPSTVSPVGHFVDTVRTTAVVVARSWRPRFRPFCLAELDHDRWAFAQEGSSMSVKLQFLYRGIQEPEDTAGQIAFEAATDLFVVHP